MKNYMYEEGSSWYVVYVPKGQEKSAMFFGPSEKRFASKKEAQVFLKSLEV